MLTPKPWKGEERKMLAHLAQQMFRVKQKAWIAHALNQGN